MVTGAPPVESSAESLPREIARELIDAILPDRPIADETEDRLGRAQFARLLAKVAASAPAEDGFVVGLVAPWGEGKSSVLALTKASLEKNFAQQVRVVRFNPWFWSGTGQLVAQYFRELTKAADAEPTWTRVAPTLRHYADLMALLTQIPAPTGPLLQVSGAIVRLVSSLLGRGAIDTGDLEAWRDRLVAAIRSRSEPNGSRLATLRRVLRSVLRRANPPGVRRRLVVLMDDIDRLQDREVHDVAQLVRLTANLPHVVYVLAYDRVRVERALGPAGEGRAYLEKVVQIPLTLPTPDPARLRSVMEEVVDAAVGRFREKEPWQRRRWDRLYDGALLGFLSNLRDTKRFTNGLLMSVVHIGYEVDPVDLVGVSALRVFAAEIYDEMRRNPDLFLGPARTSRTPIPELRERMDALEAALTELDPRRRKLAREILVQLFPHVAGLVRGEDVQRGAYADVPRICARASYWRYFALTLRPDEIPEVEVRALFELAASDPDGFLERLRTFVGGPLERDLWARLAAWLERDDVLELEERIRELVLLLAHWPELGRHRNLLRVPSVLYKLLRTERSTRRRFELLSGLIEAAHWTAVPAVWESLDDELMPAPSRARAAGAIAARMSRLADADFLSGDGVRALRVLEATDVGSCNARIARLIETDDGLLRFLNIAASELAIDPLPCQTLLAGRVREVLKRQSALDQGARATLEAALAGM